MESSTLLLIMLAAGLFAYRLGMRRSVAVVKGDLSSLHSLPKYHGHLTALWALVPAFLLFGVWTAFDEGLITRWVVADLPEPLRNLPPGRLGLVVNDIRNLVHGNIISGEVTPPIQAAADYYTLMLEHSRDLRTWSVLLLAVAGAGYAFSSIRKHKRARNAVEKALLIFMVVCSTIAIVTTIGIVASVLFESIRFFEQVAVADFLFGLSWSPQTALRADQVGSSGSFGAVPLFLGTFLISLVAMLVAAPIGLMSAIYLSEYANRHVRAVAKPLLEILAGIPTVVYGFFAALTVAPMVRDIGTALGLGGGLGKRPGRRPGHGDHDHPLRLVALRRRHQCGAPVPARRLLRPWRHPVGDGTPGDPAGRAARHRRRPAAGGLPGHRRDHDRSDGRRPLGQSDASTRWRR